jgi:hypothetical protein
MTARVVSRQLARRVKHYRGLPPELTGGAEEREQMAQASLLVVEERSDGVFLLRFTKTGECVGDTWHQTIDDAKAQAAFEFDGLLYPWEAVPPEVADAVKFGLRLADS